MAETKAQRPTSVCCILIACKPSHRAALSRLNLPLGRSASGCLGVNTCSPGPAPSVWPPQRDWPTSSPKCHAPTGRFDERLSEANSDPDIFFHVQRYSFGSFKCKATVWWVNLWERDECIYLSLPFSLIWMVNALARRARNSETPLPF